MLSCSQSLATQWQWLSSKQIVIKSGSDFRCTVAAFFILQFKCSMRFTALICMRRRSRLRQTVLGPHLTSMTPSNITICSGSALMQQISTLRATNFLLKFYRAHTLKMPPTQLMRRVVRMNLMENSMWISC